MFQRQFRGMLGNIFCKGLDVLARKLKHYPGDVVPHPTWRDMAKSDIQRFENGQISGPIIVVGHSLGAVAAVRYVRKLRAAGVPVACMFLLDYVHTLSNIFHRDEIPSDVPTYHFMSGDGRVKDIPGTYRFMFDGSDKRYPKLSHIQLDDEPMIHNIILEKLKQHAV